jgi:hypothetical protein
MKNSPPHPLRISSQPRLPRSCDRFVHALTSHASRPAARLSGLSRTCIAPLGSCRRFGPSSADKDLTVALRNAGQKWFDLFGVDTNPSYRTVDDSAEMADRPAIFLLSKLTSLDERGAFCSPQLSCTADQRVTTSHVLPSLVCSRHIALHAPDRLTTFKSAIEYGLPTIRRGRVQSASKFFLFCFGRCRVIASPCNPIAAFFKVQKKNAKTIKSSAAPRRICRERQPTWKCPGSTLIPLFLSRTDTRPGYMPGSSNCFSLDLYEAPSVHRDATCNLLPLFGQSLPPMKCAN